MKAGIHPEYKKIPVKCSCGNEFEIGTALQADKYSVEVCDKCHPFYTGKMKIIDNAGRVSDFYRKFGKKDEKNEKDASSQE